jgi:hypothetical protein
MFAKQEAVWDREKHMRKQLMEQVLLEREGQLAERVMLLRGRQQQSVQEREDLLEAIELERCGACRFERILDSRMISDPTMLCDVISAMTELMVRALHSRKISDPTVVGSKSTCVCYTRLKSTCVCYIRLPLGYPLSDIGCLNQEVNVERISPHLTAIKLLFALSIYVSTL